MKYLVTGFPGAGKSTVSDELERRGFRSYNTDDLIGFNHHIHYKTRERVDKPKNASSDWNLKHDWVWKPAKIKAALNQLGDVFICAITSNQVDYYDKFDKIFVLTLDEQTLRHRISTRTRNNYGKKPDELNHIIGNYRKFGQALAKDRGAILIDATKPLQKVVDEILRHTNTEHE